MNRDEAALVEALDSGHVASVGLDVFEEEPAVHPGLLRNERVMLLPHMVRFLSLFLLLFPIPKSQINSNSNPTQIQHGGWLFVSLKCLRYRRGGGEICSNEKGENEGEKKNTKLTKRKQGTWTFETQQKMELWTMENVRSALEKGRLVSIVPEQGGLQGE